MINKSREKSSSKNSNIPRGKSHTKSSEKTTVGIFLSKKVADYFQLRF